MGRPANSTQKGGARSLRPEWPPGRHVGFLMRSYPRWQRGHPGLRPRQALPKNPIWWSCFLIVSFCFLVCLQQTTIFILVKAKKNFHEQNKIWYNVVEDFTKKPNISAGGEHLGLRPEYPPPPPYWILVELFGPQASATRFLREICKGT